MKTAVRIYYMSGIVLTYLFLDNEFWDNFKQLPKYAN